MDLRQLTPDLAVSSQISIEDVPDLARAGFKVLINNRPDAEIDAGQGSEAMRKAAAAAGMTYVFIPFVPGEITRDMISAYAQAAGAGGPVIAYCRSGNRSAVLWALTQARLRPVDDIIAIGAKAGYDLSGLAPMLSKGIPGT